MFILKQKTDTSPLPLRSARLGLATVLSLLIVSSAGAGPVYPLKLSAGKHYLVDQSNNPFFIQGDSPWYLIQRLNTSDVEYYLSNRWAMGYNSVLLDLQSHEYGSGSATYPSADIYGNNPFTNTIAGGAYTNFLSINPNYYTNADYVLNRAAYYGMNVFLFPMYAGYQGGPEGWYADMVGNGSNALYQFGQFVGARYKSFTNIVWVLGGDYTMADPTLDDAVAAGILSMDKNHLFTAHASRGISALDYYTSSWDVLNSTYTTDISYQKALSDYQRTPVLPTFLIETYYEGRTTPIGCRQEAWGAILSGCAGHLYGRSSLWAYNSGWQDLFWSPGAATITNIIKLMRTRPWYNCIPDATHSVVVGGYGSSGNTDYISVTREATGATIMAYIPQDGMVPQVDMTKVSGSTAKAWWYDPRTGNATNFGTFATSGTQSFTPPDSNDWVLVLDDASQPWAAPGNSGPVANNQRAATSENTPVNIVLTGNDPQGLSLNYVLIAIPLHGLLTGTPPNLTYTPLLNYLGPDSFTFEVNNGNLASSIAVVSIDVAAAIPANPVVTWTNPADVVYGTALSSQQLNATANVPGAFTYRPSAGTVLSAGTNQVLTVTFTPTDTTNYNSLIINVSLNVLQAPLTITASNQVMVYGASVPALTAGYSGFVNGDTSASLLAAAVLTSTALSNSPAGSYPIVVTGATSSNYSITFVNGSLDVQKAPLTIAANNQVIVYGTSLPVLTVSYDGFVNGDTSSSLLTPPILTTTALSNSPPGSYSILVSGATSSNYAITFVNGTLTVLVRNTLNLQASSNGLFKLTSSGPPGRGFVVQYKTNLTLPWVPMGTVTADSSGNFSTNVSASPGLGFFRSVLQ